MIRSRQTLALYMRNFIFGVEDSLVSTVGFISGIAIAGVAVADIVLTGFVLISVEAFSMGVGSFLSEYSAEEFEQKKVVSNKGAATGAVIMFLSYLLSGFIPLLPYVLIPESLYVMGVSVALTLFALALLAVFNGKMSRVPVWNEVFRMIVISGLSIVVGTVVGSFIHF
ncbi:MAG: hypothetical protein UU76_C0011G0002 [Parcubacteria group bacterium GW2011_GWC1_41_7]|nr:MAG: hypothetical protein UU76_C0011G0002 [Parcubacteria group bacterium GW2011_GWC1_41_7]